MLNYCRNPKGRLTDETSNMQTDSSGDTYGLSPLIRPSEPYDPLLPAQQQEGYRGNN